MGLSPTCTLNQLTEGSLLVQASGSDLIRTESLGKWLHVFLLLFDSNFIYFWLHCSARGFL